MAGNKTFILPGQLPRVDNYDGRNDELMLIRQGRIHRGPVIEAGGELLAAQESVSEDITLNIPANFPIEPGNPVLLDSRGLANFAPVAASHSRPVAGIMLSKDQGAGTCVVRRRGLLRLRTGIRNFRFSSADGLLPVWNDWRYPGWLAWHMQSNVARDNGVRDFGFTARGLRYIGVLMDAEAAADTIITTYINVGQEDPRAVINITVHGTPLTGFIDFPTDLSPGRVNRLVEVL